VIVSTAGTRVGARDRGWLGLDSLRVLGPFDGVTAAGLRAALAGLHAHRPQHPAACLLDRRTARWVRLSTEDFAAHAAASVLAVEDSAGSGQADGDDADVLTRHLLGLPVDHRPVVLAVRGGFVGAKISHAVGDGRAVNVLLPELIRAAAAHRPASPPPAAPAAFALPRAVLHHFGRHPARLLAALPAALPAGRPPVTVAATVPWRPDPAYASVRSPAALAEIRAWRDRHLPGVSGAAIQFAATAAALERCGLPARGPGAVVLVDARRYLPEGRGAAGNFSWGLYLRPARLTDPRAVHDALAGELSAGSALAMLALRAGRLLLAPAPRAGAVPGHITADPRPRLTLTHVGRMDSYLDLPWAVEPARRRNISVPTTSGPEAVTVSLSELAGVLHLNVSFHASTFDPVTVAGAARLACDQPVQLVSRIVAA
jgi:hypothetical protein